MIHIVVDITGGRYDFEKNPLRPSREQILALFSLLASLKATALGHGNAIGTDRYVASMVKREFGSKITILPCPVDISLDGPYPAAPCRRNGRMLDTHKPIALAAFPGNIGTLDCIRKARARNIPIYQWNDRKGRFIPI